MQRSSRSHRALAAYAIVVGLAACADDPIQPRAKELPPSSPASFALADNAPATDLGTLGGADSRATSINDSGHVVGMARDTSGYLRAFLWTPTLGMRSLHVNPAALHSLAVDINNRGQVVGYVDSITTARAFIWSAGGGVKWLPTLGGMSSYAYGINNNGDVVGSSQTSSGVSHAFIWTAADGQMHDLGTLGGQAACSFGHSAAYDLNDQREVVGFSCAESGERAFLWSEAGGMVDLGTLGGPFSSRAFDINNSGHVVGVAQTANGVPHAFVWTPSAGMSDLGTLGGDSSVARSINDLGEIVGESTVIGNSMHHGFLWSDSSGMRKLGGLSGSGSAYGINATGQVVGWSRNASGFDRATGWGVSTPPPVNRPPVVSAGGPYTALEGSPIAFSGDATDPDGDPLSLSWAFGDGDSAYTATASHTYANNGSFTAVFRATDSKGAGTSSAASVSIANVAPSVSATGPATVVSGGIFNLTASFSDPGTLDAPWLASIDWADGTFKSDSTSDQSAPITATRQYFRAGTYTVRVTIRDRDNAPGAATVTFEVVRFPTSIDVDPKSASNSISMRSGGQTLSVALLSTSTYDARLADPASAVITNGSGSGTRPRDLRGSYSDANRDGRIDLILSFHKTDMIANGDLTTATTKLILLADDSNGRQTRGENVVSVKP